MYTIGCRALNDEDYLSQVWKWNADGTKFEILDTTAFSQKVLKEYFRSQALDPSCTNLGCTETAAQKMNFLTHIFKETGAICFIMYGVEFLERPMVIVIKEKLTRKTTLILLEKETAQTEALNLPILKVANAHRIQTILILLLK